MERRQISTAETFGTWDVEADGRLFPSDHIA
jgi:hypothetical protein